jgi:hypothetical protein
LRRKARARRCIWRSPRTWRKDGCRACSPSGRIHEPPRDCVPARDVACHVSTVITSARTATSSIDPLTLPGRYTSKYDLSIAGGQSAQNPNTLRALGHLRTDPMISQRVANDTAQALTEIAARYPAP